ncbi:hypothetical protein SH2C18_08580 [Clostridium sediminicola]|uniref:ABC transporter permease n=1 Tax=Clostridium sediminicola TaxID=3114879 RepID=UPI0031F1F060
MRKILNLVRQNFKLSLRNNLLLYMIGFVLVGSIAIRVFLPSVDNMEMSFVVNKEAAQDIGEELEDYGKIEIYNSIEEVEERVLRMDDTPGIVKVEDEYRVILEGNEMEAVAELPAYIIDVIKSGDEESFIEYESLGKSSSFTKHFITIIFIIAAIVIGGMVMGFSIIEEKETRVGRAYSVSPLKFGEYIISKSLITGVLGLILAIMSTVILLGNGINYGHLIVGIIFSIGFALIFGFIIGGYADNLMTGIAIMKSLFFILMGIPIAAVFVPDKFQWVMYPFPNYWSFRIFKSIIVDKGTWVEVFKFGSFSVFLTLIMFLIMRSSLKKRLKF